MDSTGTFLGVFGDTEGEAPHPVLAIGHVFPFAVRGGGDATDSQSGQLAVPSWSWSCRHLSRLFQCSGGQLRSLPLCFPLPLFRLAVDRLGVSVPLPIAEQCDTEGEAPPTVLPIGHGFPLLTRAHGDATDLLVCSPLRKLPQDPLPLQIRGAAPRSGKLNFFEFFLSSF